MKKLVLALGLLAAGAAPARAGIYYDLQQTASSATLRMVGAFKMYASAFSGAPTIQLDSVTGNINASSGTFTATGANTFSVQTSSGVNIGGTGGVWATFFKASGNFIGTLIGNVTGNLTGNADTATSLASGAAGSMPYQTGSGVTAFVTSSAGKLLSIVSTTPTWLSYLPETVTISTANVSPGFNAASRIVQLNSSNQYPALDGSLITNLSGTLSGGTNGKSVYWTGSTSVSAGPENVTATSVTLPSGAQYLIANGSTMTAQQNATCAGSTCTVGVVPIMSGIYHTIASSAPVVASTGTTFAMNFVSTASYQVTWAAEPTASTELCVRFNNDAGANYRYSNTRSILGTVADDQSNTGTCCYLTPNNGPTDQATSGDMFLINLNFRLYYSSNAKVILNGIGAFYSASRSTQVEEAYSCSYLGSAAITSFTIYPTAGSYKGWSRLRVEDN